MSTKTIKVPVGKTVSWYVSQEGYVPQRGSYVMGDATHSLNISLQTHQEAPLTMVFSGVVGTLSNIDTTKNVQYKRNDGAWTTAGSSIDVNPGDIIQFKGEYDSFDENTCWTLSNGVIIDKVCGNIGSVLDPVNYATMTTYSSTYALSYFFYGMRYGLIDAGDLVLPATTLTSYCYHSMFGGCALLTKAPALPAMNLAIYCYYNMFNNCDSLTVAPELPATTLAGNCYRSMFAYCDGLTTAPDLLAETLATGCYQSMFYNCSHLNYIKCMSHSTMRTNFGTFPYTSNWVTGVAAEGTFVSYVHNSSWTTGVSAIPTGWVNQTIGDQHTITIVPTPADATVIMNGVEQSSIYDWYGNSYTWSVSKTGYVTQSGSGVIRGDATIPVNLVLETHTFSINTAAENTVIINGQQRTSITADYGTSITWSVSREGYVSQSGSLTLTADSVLPVNLVLETHTFSIVSTPANAVVTINGQQRTSITADWGTTINWNVSAAHYVSQSGSFTLTTDSTMPVALALTQHTFTINPTPSNAVVMMNGVEGTSITADYGTTVAWSVSKDHYVSQSGSYVIGDNDYSLNVNLVLENHTFTITPTPVDAVVTINGQQRTSLTAPYGTAITWSVSKSHYVSQNGSLTLESDTTLPVSLVLENHTFSITATPADAMVVINGLERGSITAPYGTSITWSVSREGYTAQSGSYTLNQDHTESVSLVINQYTFTIDTDAENTVVINGVERTSITTDYETTISWSVSRDHYVTQSGSFSINRNSTLYVVLSLEQFTFSINPTPADAVVTINGQVRSSLTADWGTSISWSVSRQGCVPRSGSIASLVEDTTISVELVELGDYPMTFDVITNGTITWQTNNSEYGLNCPIYYKLNDGDWTLINSDMGGSVINVVMGDQVSFRGNNARYWRYYTNTITTPVSYILSRCFFGGTALFNAYGNALSMIYGSRFIEDKYDMTQGLYTNSLAWLMRGSNVVNANNMCLTATILPDPISSPEAAKHGVYEGMFEGCLSLISAPELPATTLPKECYEEMFKGCTNLSSTPILPAETLSQACYSEMFMGCTRVNYIKCLAKDITALSCTLRWLDGVAAEGTFVKNPDMNSWSTGTSGIPAGWTVINAS